MYPHELNPQILNLPEAKDKSIVIITEGSLRHQRFALRLMETFGDQVIARFEMRRTFQQTNVAGNSLLQKLKQKLNTIDTGNLTIKTAFNKLQQYLSQRKANVAIDQWYGAAENYLFKNEVERLKNKIQQEPEIISNPNTPEFYEKMEALQPYFFISLGGPLYSKNILKHIRGCAINQHAGHSPDYKGNRTVEWALYHRELEKVSSTVHITAAGADTGGILRRASACLLANENPAIYFNRIVALGTELIIEVVQDLMDDKPVYCFPQPKYEGKTKISTHFEPAIRRQLWQDQKNGVIDYLIHQRRQF